ncbi:hypothetical protein ABZ498_18025 [Streptomyces lavendulocolor]|uniref:hypothetical protein n=1 Tax=Streptomyces lavendulocolor TaxID=67316 RepID=UPI0033C27547
MSNEQPPRDDEQGDEPTVGHYTRADASKFPTHPAGQQAAVEGTAAAHDYEPDEEPRTYTSGEILRTMKGPRPRMEPTPAARQFFDAMLSEFERFEQARRAEIIAAGGTAEDADDDGWGDTFSRDNLRSIARAHRNATQPHRAKEGDLDRLLDDLANEFDLYDVRIIRGVAAALADAMPRIAHKHREQGMSPDEIARKTGYTASRIAQFIRQEKARRAAPGTLHRYTWRIDVQDAEGAWNPRESGEDQSDPADVAQLAERLLVETGARDQRARIVMWDGDEGDDDAAIHRAERDPQ